MPQPALFALDEKDHEKARATNRPAMLSVFDRERTSVAEAWDIFGRRGEQFTFELTVEGIAALSRHLPENARRIRVLRDLHLDPEVAQKPGSDGHCGIDGLNRKSGAPTKPYKNVRFELSRIARLVDD